MKKAFTLFLSLFATICVLSTIYASEQIPPDEIPIYTGPPPGGTPHSPAAVPFSCFLFSSLNSMSIQSTSITTLALVVVENTTTSVSTQENILISSIPSSISLFGPGQYTMTITLLSGSVFYGTFAIQ